MKTAIYYFTGTGNSLKIASDLAASIEGSELTPMAAHWRDDRITTAAETVGFVHPLYWYGLPGLVREFVRKIDLATASYAFAVATCQIPRGVCHQQMASLSAEKGKTLEAGFYVPMPNNYILGEYRVPPQAEREELFRKAAALVKHIAEVVTEGGRHMDDNLLSDALSRRHAAWVREAGSRDQRFMVQESCDGCGICAMVCPVGNIEMVNDRPQWQHRCEQCLACIHHCARGAIEYGQDTVGKERYRHPDISVKDITAQKRIAM